VGRVVRSCPSGAEKLVLTVSPAGDEAVAQDEGQVERVEDFRPLGVTAENCTQALENAKAANRVFADAAQAAQTGR
jgi:hypothetical protein